MKKFIMIFCQYFEYIHIVAFNPLAFQFSTQIYVWCFCFVIPLLSMKFRSTQPTSFFKEYIANQEADMHYVGSAPIVQFANYFMSPGNYEKQSHRCQSASS